MNISELRSVLNIVDGKIAGGNISLSGGSLTANLLYLIQKCYDGNLPISSAELTLDDGKGSIKMKGKSPFLGADNIPVAVEFKLESGQVSFSITYDFSGTKTSLKTLLDKYASNIPLPAGLYIDSLGVSAEKMETFAMSLSMAGEPDPWTIPIGPTHLTVSDVGLKLSYKKGGSPGGSFDGKIALGDFATIDMDYTVPADFVIQGNIPNVHLLRLTKQLTNIPLELPADFDISFTDTSIVIKKEGNDYTFQLGTKLADALYLGMQIEKGDAGWGFAAGFDWKKGTVAGNAIGSAIDTFMGLFALSNFMVVVSSLDKADFTFPDFDEFKKPAISAGRITLPSQADGIIPGLNVFAQWVIDKSANDQKFLKKFLSLGDSLGITLQVGKQPTADSRLYVAFKKEICKHELIGEFG
ncbi:MAG: hypothetical protein GY765_35790, partial [bacterium]|nr:hypothetical protein [bacterium]